MRLIGTVRRILAQIRRHTGLILRVAVWATLIGLAILSAYARHEWWRGTTRERLAWAVVALLVTNILIDIVTRRARRPAGWLGPVALLSLAGAGYISVAQLRWGWTPVLVIGYLLWRFIPWPTPATAATAPTPPTLAQTHAQAAAQAAAQAEAAALAAGVSHEAAAAIAAAAAAAAKAPASAPSHGTVIGRWYFGTIPIIRLPLLTVRYSLGQGVVYRQVFGRLRDTEVFGNIKNWDITPDDVTARGTGACTFRILPDKIGEKALEVWTGMPINFALDLDEALTRAKVK